MSFRKEDTKYKLLRKKWWHVVAAAYEEGEGTRVSEVDNLMLASFRLHRYIKLHLRNGALDIKSNLEEIPTLNLALKRARKVVAQIDGLHALISEADALEALSRACYKYLKENKKLKNPEDVKN